ncbi:PepSY-associated TM helix domain-containing protein [Aurantivibrio plasticivorans]
MRSDIIKMYKDVHTWVGIVSGLALFIAFYGGAITMFEGPLQRWASPPAVFGELTPLDKTPELVERVIAEYPDAARSYQVVLKPSAGRPARINWQVHDPDAHDHDHPVLMHANLSEGGDLVVASDVVSPLPQLVDDLHRQVGILLDHDIAMPIMGVVALLYGVALISGVIILVPTFVQDLFAFRLGKNLKRMWLDFHNLLGIFSLPFHLVMALTAVIFAFHDPIYGAQEELVFQGGNSFLAPNPGQSSGSVGEKIKPLTPAEIVARLHQQLPEYQPNFINYRVSPQAGPALLIFGDNPRYGARSPDGGVVGVDAFTGDIVASDYTPGLQSAWGATITSFFTLHFGTYGGSPIRWSYFVLGLAGALLFYTGNLLWLETRRKKQRKTMSLAQVNQKQSTRIMGALTVGVSLGCVAGISLSIAAAKVLPSFVEDVGRFHTAIYYAVFFMSVLWSLWRGVAQASVDLLVATAISTAMIPMVSLLSLIVPGFGWNYPDYSVSIDLMAMLGVAVLLLLAIKTLKRIRSAPEDSIWFVGEMPAGAKNTVVAH